MPEHATFGDLQDALAGLGITFDPETFIFIDEAESILEQSLKQMGMDPALMSNPLIASLSDILGVLIYYNVALFALGNR